jgi:sigma-B regulation protein RsbU (phosphoserine phosphatase)
MTPDAKPPIIGEARGSLRRTVLQDLRRADLSRTLRHDLRQIYRFYLDEERRTRLASMGRVRRVFWSLIWLLKGLLLKLSPPRRVVLLITLVMWFLGRFVWNGETTHLAIDLRRWAFPLLLVVLMMELKDKLLAKDEIAVAREVQLALLPRSDPQPEGWGLWSFMRPANDVGADLVDYIDLGEGRLGVVLGDVSGKGLGAALLTAKLQATLRALRPDSVSLEALGARLNAVLHRDGLDNRFATLFYFEIRSGAGTVRFLNAGHNPPFILRAGGVESLPASSRPLGMFPEERPVEGRTEVAAGEMLLVYSDGLTEARNAADEEFGSERLTALLPRLRGLEPAAAGARVLQEVNTFLGGERPHDDLSVIVALRRPPSGPSA